MNKTLGSRAVPAGHTTVTQELPRPPAGTAAQPVLKRSNSMPELQVEPAKRGAVRAPALSRHPTRRSIGDEDPALARFRETHARMMSQVTQDLASADKEGQKVVPEAVKHVVTK